MPRDASGTYTLPIAPFVPLTLAKSADMNAALTDIAAALTDSQSRASPTPAQGDLNMNGHNILNLGEVVGELNASGGVWANGVGSLFGFALEGPNYIWHWGAADYFDWFNPATGLRSWRAAGADVMTLSAAGTLTVSGSISAASGTVTANAVSANSASVNGTLGVGGNLSCSGNLGVGGTATLGATTISTATIGAATVNGNLGVGGTATLGAATIGNATVNGTLSVGGPATLGNATISNATLGNATVNGTLGVGGAVSAATTITAGGAVRGYSVIGYIASGQGGFVGSYQGNSTNVGFVNSNNTIVFGNANGNGDWVGPSRATLDPSGHLTLTGNVYAAGVFSGGGNLTVGPNSATATFDTGGNLTINNNGFKPGGGAWASTSDARLKTEQGAYEHGLAEVLALRPVRYVYTANPSTEYVGLIAQEAELVMPEMVSQTAGNIDGEAVEDLRVLDTTALTYALVRAVQELSAQVASLQAEAAALKSA